MSTLDFLSPDRATTWHGSTPRLRSPLAARLPDATIQGVEDVSFAYGKLEVRGDVDAIDVAAEVVTITPERALVLCPYGKTSETRAELEERFTTVVDMTGALAALKVTGVTLVRRLTDLDLDRLPAVGAVAGVRALVVRDSQDVFRLFFGQEYGAYLADAVVDTARGLA